MQPFVLCQGLVKSLDTNITIECTHRVPGQVFPSQLVTGPRTSDFGLKVVGQRLAAAPPSFVSARCERGVYAQRCPPPS